VLSAYNYKALADEAEKRNGKATINNPGVLLNIMKELDPEKGANLENTLREFHFKLVLNQLRRQDNPNTGLFICKIIERHLSLKMHFLGSISFDDRVHNSICKKIPFLDLYPYTQAALDLRECSKNMQSIIKEKKSIFSNYH
jgi:MinD-like ATPase involved in chromosome partitioning or flagellar assembly